MNALNVLVFSPKTGLDDLTDRNRSRVVSGGETETVIGKMQSFDADLVVIDETVPVPARIPFLRLLGIQQPGARLLYIDAPDAPSMARKIDEAVRSIHTEQGGAYTISNRIITP